jgi:hypothetical protein
MCLGLGGVDSQPSTHHVHLYTAYVSVFLCACGQRVLTAFRVLLSCVLLCVHLCGRGGNRAGCVSTQALRRCQTPGRWTINPSSTISALGRIRVCVYVCVSVRACACARVMMCSLSHTG